jgi:sterol desaturase/sphingolipid hydroxylase (fatty acid hydroxylase superfamily)
LIEYAVLPLWLCVICLLETTSIVVALNYLHTQFHLLGPRLEQSRWFLEARARHEHHHDLDVNFMVGDHFWDRCFRTYQSAHN